METNIRMSLAAKNAVDSLFFIKTNTENEKLKEECQKIINALFKAFSDALPQPQDQSVLFTEHGNCKMKGISMAIAISLLTYVENFISVLINIMIDKF